jgi:hypothetical protein
MTSIVLKIEKGYQPVKPVSQPTGDPKPKVVTFQLKVMGII